MITKLELIKQVCRNVGIGRRKINRPNLTKEELYKINCYLTMINK